MQKRAQVAMEFLMTYGWALLTVLIAIGALAFFGVLNPSKFLPEMCSLGPGLACEGYKVQVGASPTDDTNRIFINVRNGMGKDFDLFTIYADKATAGGSEACGGYLGLIAHPNFAPFVPQFGLFKDGEMKPLKAPSPPLSDGINCNKDGIYLNANCCNVGIYNIGSQSLCGLLCGPSNQIPNRGSKFNEKLVIVYKEKGSDIIHQRIGQLSARVE